jgi:hypothetical protein
VNLMLVVEYFLKNHERRRFAFVGSYTTACHLQLCMHGFHYHYHHFYHDYDNHLYHHESTTSYNHDSFRPRMCRKDISWTIYIYISDEQTVRSLS